ncbi:acyl-protein thioesterase 2 [Phtheirospermum japonicum]|uniref:Acyl-protein thioesterase 2 n=1 Tax=Phtheirospermum japonicum TaxID=374723 RepID=A0A830CCY4_9LAMI|nr:acyl-protein thioesterase 2 [Phtheirospermum japonicum]
MSYSNSSMGSGSRTGRRTFEFGRTYVVKPKGKHQATLVWLHGLGDNGSSWSTLLESLSLPNIKWICPTAPTRPVTILGGFSCAAWFDMGELSEDCPDDFEGLDASAAHIANLLSTEPADIKLGIGGFSMGAATALYSATCFAHGKYSSGHTYPVNLRAVVGLSGDEVVPHKHGEKSYHALSLAGFRNLAFKTYEGIGHYTVPKEMDEVMNIHYLDLRSIYLAMTVG